MASWRVDASRGWPHESAAIARSGRMSQLNCGNAELDGPSTTPQPRT